MLNVFRDRANEITSSKGFWDDYKIIMKKVRDACINNGTALFNDQEISRIDEAFSNERLLMVISEIGEMVEAKRSGKKADWKSYNKVNNIGFDPKAFKKHIKDSPEDELADAIIRIFSLAGLEGIDLQKHVSHKLIYNDSREYLHGKKF